MRHWRLLSGMNRNKVLSKGSAHILSSMSKEMDGNSTSCQRTPEPPVWAQQLFQQQAEILEKLKNIPQGRQGRNESVESPEGPRACFKCGSLNHFIHNCPHQLNHDQGNWRRAGHSQNWPRPINLKVHLCRVVWMMSCPMLYWTLVQKQQLSVMTLIIILTLNKYK